MFSYYGSKSKIVDCYPSPKYGKIIEPFAGSARYALKWFDRDVLLVDKYPVIVKIWHYLQSASEKDIMSLPEPKYKENIDIYNLSEGERLLMSFLVADGIAAPQYIVQKFSNIPRAKRRIAKSLYKIKHWEIILGSYDEIDNQDATWFIDPPYQIGGHKYIKNNINYEGLANWCKSRNGQVIVCENTKADWLPFRPMREMTGSKHTTVEALWSNLSHDYVGEQLSLFGNLPPNNRVQPTAEKRGG